jgi:acetoin utilization deacetylase AcuC-like enzyme
LTIITCNSCLLHRYIRDKNLRYIFERSERIQSIYKTLDYLKNKLSENSLLMKVVDSTRLPPLDDDYVLEVHSKEFIEAIEKWCQESIQKLSIGNNEVMMISI